MSNDKENLTGHEYDGIRELDNPLPDWWLITFLATIIFSGIYYIHYESGVGPTQKQELEMALAERKAKQEQNKEQGPQISEESLAAVALDPAVGAASFQGKCAVCHNADGGGSIGPNLTDRHWLHGTGSRLDIYNVIAGGVPAKGMPAWKSLLSENEATQVALFVYALREKPSANGKPAQGTEYK